MHLIADFHKQHPAIGTMKISLRLDLPAQQLVWIQGIQGSGKSTLLRTLAGLERPERGTISLDGQIWFHGDGKRSLDVPSRPIALSSKLCGEALGWTASSFLSKTLSHWPTRSRGKRVKELLDLSGLSPEAGRKVHLLTEEQQRRLALLKSLAPRPKFLLLDDFFEGLDRAAAKSLLADLRRILHVEQMPALLGALPQDVEIQEGELLLHLEKGRFQGTEKAA